MLTFSTFASGYDQPGAVILLEGKRLVRDEDAPLLIALGKMLAQSTRYMLFRSGNAPGADALFAEGVVAVDAARLQVITPYKGHRQRYNQAKETISLEEIPMAAEAEVLYQTRAVKKYAPLVDAYLAGANNAVAAKAAYLLRDTVKVLGTSRLPAATVGLFYDDLRAPRQGGTGHTMQVCINNHIPIYDQTTWFEWLKTARVLPFS